MKTPVWIELPVVLALHDMQLVMFGGKAGTRDLGLLESALLRPEHLRHYKPSTATLPRLAAAYAFGIVKNHPFVDGNKRTGLIVAFVFLSLNGREITASEEDTYRVFMDLASGRMQEEQLAVWIKQNSE